MDYSLSGTLTSLAVGPPIAILLQVCLLFRQWGRAEIAQQYTLWALIITVGTKLCELDAAAIYMASRVILIYRGQGGNITLLLESARRAYRGRGWGCGRGDGRSL